MLIPSIKCINVCNVKATRPSVLLPQGNLSPSFGYFVADGSYEKAALKFLEDRDPDLSLAIGCQIMSASHNKENAKRIIDSLMDGAVQIAEKLGFGKDGKGPKLDRVA